MAHISETLRPIPVMTAISKIKSNNSNAFIWFVVVNKTGSIFEIGGTNKAMKMTIPHYNEDGSVKQNPQNDFIRHNFEISAGEAFVHPVDGVNMEFEKFIKVANKTNFHNVSFTPGHHGEVVYKRDVPANWIINEIKFTT